MGLKYTDRVGKLYIAQYPNWQQEADSKSVKCQFESDLGYHGVDVCAIFSASKKSKEMGFAGSARKPANIWKQRFMSQCYHHLFDVDSRAISRASNVGLE